MNPDLIARLCRDLTTAAGLGPPIRREQIRVWRLSGVERLHLTDGRTVVLKYAAEPFTGEDHVLTFASGRGVPVPALHASTLHASTLHDGTLCMIMEDLGDQTRPATETDAAVAATRLHATGSAPDLPTFGQTELQALPGSGLAYLDQLRAADRFTDTTDCATHLRALDKVARRRAAGANLPPFGLCHA